MHISIAEKRPATFVKGGQYLWRSTLPSQETKVVRFIGYDPCPAFIIVLDSSGQKMRCPRDDVFLPPGS